jgi:hypothetical protein
MDVFNSLGPGFWKALGYLVISGVVFLSYYFGTNEWRRNKYNNETNNELGNEALKKYWIRILEGLAVIAAIAFIGASMLGTSSDCSDADPVYGGCTTLQEFIPTVGQRYETFFYILFLLGIPFSVGAYNEAKKVKSEELEEYYKSDEYKRKQEEDYKKIELLAKKLKKR